MDYRKPLAALAALGLAVTAMAGDEKHMNLSIAVIDDTTHDEVRVDFDSETLGFDLEDLQVGENRAVVDKNGQNVLITREENGYKLDVDGKTIRTPLYHGHDGPAHPAPLPPLPPVAPGNSGTTIISAEPLDGQTQQAIRGLLESAGHDADVRFIDRGAPGAGLHEVRIVEKRVENRVEETQ